jgi:ABC-type bacteriocin/lantibiotic exporter with double-glycine peptidase domain
MSGGLTEMARAKISYFSLWQIDPYAAKESAQSPKRIEKLLYKAAEFFVLKPQDILRLGKRMPISEAIINLSSQLGMNGKIISKEEIRRNDNLPIIAWHQLKKEISLLVPYSRGRFLIVNEKNNRGQLIHFDEIPQIFNNLMLLFVAEKNESRSMFELNNFIRRCVPLNLLALSSVIKIVVIFAFFFLCSRLFISASSLQFYVLGFGLTCLLGMIFVSDYLLIHCGAKIL